MKFKSLFLLFTFFIFGFASFDIQAKPAKKSQQNSSSALKEFSANRTEEAETLCSQKNQTACSLLQMFYILREDSKSLNAVHNKACKVGLSKTEDCTSAHINRVVNSSIESFRSVKKQCDSGKKDACVGILANAIQIGDLEMKDIYAKKACKTGMKEVCGYDVNKELRAISNPQQAKNEAKKSALNDCKKGQVQACNALINEAAVTNDEKLMKDTLQTMCKSGKNPSSCKTNAKTKLKETQQALQKGIQEQVKQINKECDSKNTLEICVMAVQANIQIVDEAGIKKYAAKVCKLGGEGKKLCKTEVSKLCKSGDKQACELQKLL